MKNLVHYSDSIRFSLFRKQWGEKSLNDKNHKSYLFRLFVCVGLCVRLFGAVSEVKKATPKIAQVAKNPVEKARSKPNKTSEEKKKTTEI